ncbi:MAG: hypothetical protein P9X27_03185, partial [Candidatus Kaelpia aquatica]|nr:hypothetical protein [Candidatus Kaelpia aquatica]
MKRLICIFLAVVFLISSSGIYPTREVEAYGYLLLWFVAGYSIAAMVINGVEYDAPPWWYEVSVDEIAAEFVNPQGEESKEEALTGLLYHAQRDSSVDLSVYGATVLETLRLSNNNYDKKSFIKFLGVIKHKEAGSDLVRLFTETDDEELQIACVRTLGVLGDEAAASLLHEHLEKCFNRSDVPQDMAAALSGALGLLGDESSSPLFKQMLQEKDWPLRCAAAVGLGYLGLGRVELEQALVEESNNDTKVAMLDALGKIGDVASVGVIV